MTQRPFSNLAKIVYKRTYSRSDTGTLESWPQTVERVLQGNLRIARDIPGGIEVGEEERLRYFMLNRKSGPAGRGWWYSGSPGHARFGGAALNNCWYFSMDDWMNFVLIQDMLMLGGGTGASVEHRFVSHLPKIKKGVVVVHKATKDADFIVPDSREGWCELFRRTLESYFVTGRSFSYSTVCVRGSGEKIVGFGGKASGPIPLIDFIEKVSKIFQLREGKHLRPIDAGDIVCATGEMVVAGNIRRSAIILLGDAWDKEYLKAKRWDLGVLPTQRSAANWSVVCDDVEDLHPLFWKTYEHGEPFGIVNRKNIQKFGRMGELKNDTAVGVNPCAEATLESGEACNLQEQCLTAFEDENEFVESSRLMHRWGKRVSLERYHHEISQSTINKNRRVGTGLTGCLASPLFNPQSLNRAYEAIQQENVQYSKSLGINPSIRTTVIKPSGTLSKLMDCPTVCGIHGAFSRYFIQRVRFAAEDALIPLLKAAGHHIEPVLKLDGSLDHTTLVVDFYLEAPEGVPCSDEGHTTWKQLDVLLMAQKYWSDQAVSVTVYYKKEEIPELKAWLAQNLQYLKTISFLCHNDHGFKQAPWEAIKKDEYEKKASKVKDLEIDEIGQGSLDVQDCESGACPVK